MPCRRQAFAGALGGGGWSCGNSLLPTIVRFMPTCSVTSLPLISTVIFSLTFQPSEPVENSFGTALYSRSPIFTVMVLACSGNSARVIGEDDFFAMILLQGYGYGGSLPVPRPAASYHEAAGRRQGIFSPRPAGERGWG